MMMLTVLRSRITPPKLESIRLSRVKCSLCDQYCSRKVNFSTGTPKLQNSNALPLNVMRAVIKKKPSRRKDGFAEMLQIGGSTKKLRTKVSKISSRSLDTIHPMISSAPQDAAYEVPHELSEHEIEPRSRKLSRDGPFAIDLAHETEEVVETHLQAEPQLPQGLSTRRRLMQVNIEALLAEGKERSLQDALLTYLELCVKCGFTHRGWVTLNYYANGKKKKISDHRIFNMLMFGYASQGNLNKLLEVWNMMESCELQPNATSFAMRIEAVARSNKPEKSDLLKETISLLEQKELDLNDMFTQTLWQKDSREVVLEAVRIVRPQFTPSYPPPVVGYSNPLVNDMNDLDNSTLVPPSSGILDEDTLFSSFKEQLDRERKSIVTVRSVEKEPEHTELMLLYRNRLDDLLKSWEKCVMSALQREIAVMNAQHTAHRISYMQLNLYPFLVVLEKRQYKDIIMQEVKKLAEGSESFSPVTSLLHRTLGAQVRQRYIVKAKMDSGVLDKMDHLYRGYIKWYLNPQVSSACNGRQQWQKLKHQMSTGPDVDIDPTSWPSNVLGGIGKFLYGIILKDLKIDVNIMKPKAKTKHCLPAFYTVYRHEGGHCKEEVKPHPVLSRIYRAAHFPHLTFNVNDTPSLCPPVPWSSLHSGGYIVAKSNLIRLPQEAVQQWERMKSAPQQQLYPLYDSLNQLSSIPWKVNQPVLDTITEVFNTGGSSKLDIPEPPSLLSFPEKITPGMSHSEKSQLFKDRILMRRKKAEMYSLWCDALYRLSLANHFRDKIFWLPHNMDFRGRVYPCPPHLNHLGSDMSRSMLQFAKGQPLGQKGLDWLKIHAVNLTGLKKRNSLDERLQYANSLLHLILDSANNPLGGEKWWQDSEEPWQTLACCFEIRDALNCPNGPEKFVSHFPVHQDGSCNGLQHYAALGRDEAGAFSVNLSSAPEPQDVYSAVAAIVERVRSEDAANGVEVAQVLEGFVRRKVIKQTVMTTVYGVTRFGARLQIAKQLKDIEDFPKQHVWSASTYLAGRTFDSIREMFTSTREIQDWFTESARLISSFCGRNVEYLTPLGLPVVQPYFRMAPKNSPKLPSGRYYENLKMDMFEKPNVMKQKNAFPPNFIHSLDSSHMMLTSLSCERAGITFVSVHDCFWTHACSVEIMNRVCREQFVALHSQPILDELSEFLYRQYGYSDMSVKLANEKAQVAMKKLNKLVKTRPRQGSFNLENVLNSVYFFS